MHQRALNPVLIYWRKGFFIEEENAGGPYRLSDSRSELELDNTLDFPRTVRLTMRFDTTQTERSTLTVAGETFAKDFSMKMGEGPVLDEVIVVPPGRHVIRFSSTAPPTPPHKDLARRSIAFSVSQYHCDELNLPKPRAK